MICISVTPESRQLAKVDILNAARQCDLVELCLDNLLKEPDVKDMLDGAKKPILVSCRRQADGGKFQGSEEDRLALLRQAILAGPAYVELDIDAARRIPRFGKVQRVVSFTELARPFTQIEDLFDEAVSANADVIKFTGPTPTLEAAWPLLAAVSQKRAIPIVALGLGKSGLTFSLLGRKYGSPWIYAALERGMEAFEGQPTVGELDENYRWRQISTKTRFVAVAGFSELELAISKVFNAGFDTLAMNTRCLPFDIGSTDQLVKMLDILKVPAVIVTPSYGRLLAKLGDPVDEFGKVASAADLLVKQGDAWQTHSLMWRTILRCLEASRGPAGEARPLERRNVLVIGANGVAASMVLAAKRRGALVSVAAGDEDAAKALAMAQEVRYVPAAKVYETLVDVLVLTEPNLNYGSKRAPINPSILRPGMTVLDASSLPGEVPLMDEAALRGANAVHGAEVFADYAQMLFKSLTGQDLPPEAFAQGLLAD